MNTHRLSTRANTCLLLTLGSWLILRLIESGLRTHLLQGDALVGVLAGLSLLFGLALLACLALALHAIIHIRQDAYRALGWLAFLALIAAAVAVFDSYRIAALGLFGTLSGYSATGEKGLEALLRLYPYQPVVVLNAIGAYFADLPVRGPYRFLPLETTQLNIGLLALLGPGLVLSALMWRQSRSGTLLFFAALTIGASVANRNASNDESLALNLIAYGLLLTAGLWLGLVIYAVLRGSRPGAARPVGSVAMLALLLVGFPVLADAYNHWQVELGRIALVQAQRDDARRRAGGPMAVAAITLNVRRGPSTEYPVVDQIHLGDRVEPLAAHDGWARIGRDRWVSMNYLRPVGHMRLITSDALRMVLPGDDRTLELSLARIDRDGRLHLDEFDRNNRKTGRFTLEGSCVALLRAEHEGDDCRLSGNWQRPDGSDRYAVSSAM